MKIIVCMKQVPDTTEVKFNPVTGALDRSGIPTIINPDDKTGLELALRIKEELGAHITVITMGPGQSEQLIRESLAMGADEGILITDRMFGGSDSLATSNIIASAIRKLEYDLIITGRQAIDGDTAQVGPQIAEFLNLPSAIYVEELQAKPDHVVVKRSFENSYQKLKITYPCLITVMQEAAQPRIMNANHIFTAFDEGKMKVWTSEDIDLICDIIGIKKSPTRVYKTFTKMQKQPGDVLYLDKQEAAKLIVEKLVEKSIV